jgi:hypothetical protein
MNTSKLKDAYFHYHIEKNSCNFPHNILHVYGILNPTDHARAMTLELRIPLTHCNVAGVHSWGTQPYWLMLYGQPIQLGSRHIQKVVIVTPHHANS